MPKAVVGRVQLQMRTRTPIMIALSATLKLGHGATDKKSITYPNLKRSKRLLTAPPVIPPMAIVCQGRGRACRMWCRRSPVRTAIDATARIGTSPDNKPNAAPRFSVYSNASQPAANSTRDSSRLGPMVETMSDFVSWSVVTTDAATATSLTVSLRAGTQRLLALDQGLAFDAVGDVGERFEPLFTDRFPAALARAVVSFFHAFQRAVDLDQNLIQVLGDRDDAFGFSHVRSVIGDMIPQAAVLFILVHADRPHLRRHVRHVALDLRPPLL